MTACPSCGASVPEGATRCPLCGTDLSGAAPGVSDAETAPGTVAEMRDALDSPPPVGPRPCPVCGHLNPADARFCNACGSTLGAAARTVRAAPPPADAVRLKSTPDPEAPSGATRQALILVGAAVLAVVALYVATSRSGAPTDPTPATPPTAGAPGAAGAQAAAVPDGPAPPLADSLQQAADGLEAQNTAQGWYEAGRYYLTAGFDAQQAGDATGVLWIRRAIEDFGKSLDIAEDPDVRFALAEASQFDPSDPMRPVVELRTLLAETPEHLGGNFLLGQRRMLIGRLDSARVSFERVVALAPAGDPLRERAQEMIAQMATASAPTRGAPDGASAAPPAGTPAAPILPPAQ